MAWWKAHEQGEVARALPSRPAANGPIGIVQPTPLGTDSSVSRAPLALHLTATRLGRNSREGFADVGVNARTPQTYRAGAIMANGARLEEVYSDFVVLERDDRRTRLYVEGRAPATDPTPVVDSMLSVGGTAANPPARADSRDTLTEFVRVAPLFEGDHVRALELYPSPHSDGFARLGLEPGDRVTAIDGVPVKGSREAIGQLRRLSEGALLNVTVERGGRSQALMLDGSLVKSRGTRG